MKKYSQMTGQQIEERIDEIFEELEEIIDDTTIFEDELEADGDIEIKQGEAFFDDDLPSVEAKKHHARAEKGKAIQTHKAEKAKAKALNIRIKKLLAEVDVARSILSRRKQTEGKL